MRCDWLDRTLAAGHGAPGLFSLLELVVVGIGIN